MVLILLVAIAGLSLALALASIANTTALRQNEFSVKALYIAEAGLAKKLAEMDGAQLSLGYGLEPLQENFAGGGYAVEVTDWSNDGEDNDGNGLTDDLVEQGIYTVRSRGTYGDRSRTVEAVVQRIETEPPEPLGAINLYNPKDENGEVIPGTLVNFSGSPPRISGQDTNIPKTKPFKDLKALDVTIGSGSSPSLLGVAVHDPQSVLDIVSELGNKPERLDGLDLDALGDTDLQTALQEGIPGAPIAGGSVANVGDFDPLDAAEIKRLADIYASHAAPENTFTETNYPSGNAIIGTLDEPQITVIKTSPGEEIALTGNVSGAGVLVIDGHVRFGGTFNFAGVVVITSDGIAEVELKGTPLIFGSMYAANPNPELAGEVTMLDLRGTADVYYSTEALDIARTALETLPGITVMAKRETR